MSGGSLKDVVKALNGALSAPLPPYPVPDDIVTVIHSYIDKQYPADDHESQRLHEELLALHASKVQNSPEKHAFFLTCFRLLQPAITGVERLGQWWETLLKPTLDSIGQAKAVVDDARRITLSVLVYDEDDDPAGEKAKASEVFTDKLFGVFLEKTKLLTSDRGAGFREEQNQRVVGGHVEAVLLAFGKRMPLIFLRQVDKYIVRRTQRLQILGLLCSFVRMQGPHLYQILQTPLFDHLLQCLENDTSTTVVSLALTALVMFMPHLCNSLGEYLPRLFVIYTRIICWEKFGAVHHIEETKFVGSKDSYSRTATPAPLEGTEETKSTEWEKLDTSFESVGATTPDVNEYFSFLYGLYPINFVGFIREPYKYLEKAQYNGVDFVEIEEETIRQRSEPHRQRHTLHPNFFNYTAETELNDQSRWMKVEPADVTAQCVGLQNNNLQIVYGSRRVKKKKNISNHVLPGAFIPTEDIPTENLLSSGDESVDRKTYSWRNSEETAVPGDMTQMRGLLEQDDIEFVTSPVRDQRTPDSPTIPPTLSPVEQEEQIKDMLSLQERLRASLHNPFDSPIGPPPSHPPPATPPENAGASPRLNTYLQQLDKSNLPRSPAIRPAETDTQGTIAYLQREMMLLKNDLNFERYLKQQHLSHIGHLQRNNIKGSTAEAETQNLINTNKSLKAKLEEAKKGHAASRQEALKSKNQAKKWEAELSAKMRVLREEQKAWRQEEESLRSALKAAQEETDHLRKLLSESEAGGLRSRHKLQSLSAQADEIDKLRGLVDQLNQKNAELEARAEEFDLQRHNEESANSQVERMKLRLQSRERETLTMKRNYESKINELESHLHSQQHPAAPRPGPGMDAMLQAALEDSRRRYTTLKTAYEHLNKKHCDLEVELISLRAVCEVDSSYTTRQSSLYTEPVPSESSRFDMNSTQSPRDVDPTRRNFRSYRDLEESMSQHSSFTESSNETYGGAPRFYDTRFATTGRSAAPAYMHDERERMHYEGMVGSPPSSAPLSSNPMIRRKMSVPENMSTVSTMSPSGGTEEMHSLHTTSTGSSERDKKVLPKSEIRIRGRGGVQNIGKSPAEKEEKKRRKDEEKKSKKSKFTTGSGLAGIRGFVA